MGLKALFIKAILREMLFLFETFCMVFQNTDQHLHLFFRIKVTVTFGPI